MKLIINCKLFVLNNNRWVLIVGKGVYSLIRRCRFGFSGFLNVLFSSLWVIVFFFKFKLVFVIIFLEIKILVLYFILNIYWF